MRGWLLDTNVLSATGPGKRPLPPEQVTWFRDRTGALYFSTVTAAEVEAGIAHCAVRAPGREPTICATGSTVFLLPTQIASCPSILRPHELPGTLSDAAQAAGRYPGFAEVAIAAIAKARDLVVATSNRCHFEPLGVDIVNPFDTGRPV